MKKNASGEYPELLLVAVRRKGTAHIHRLHQQWRERAGKIWTGRFVQPVLFYKLLHSGAPRHQEAIGLRVGAHDAAVYSFPKTLAVVDEQLLALKQMRGWG